jgi:hypothetical protein
MAYEELKKIFPAEIVKLESGEEVSVSPVPFGKLTAFGEALASIISKLTIAGVDLEKLSAEDIGRVFSVAFEEIIGVMMMVLKKDREWFDNITLSDGLGLLMVIVRQNFNDDVKKKLSALLPRIQSISI